MVAATEQMSDRSRRCPWSALVDRGTVLGLEPGNLQWMQCVVVQGFAYTDLCMEPQNEASTCENETK
jgi:hypothetical protein